MKTIKFTVMISFIIYLGCAGTGQKVDTSINHLLSGYTSSSVQTMLILPVEDLSADQNLNTVEVYNSITQKMLGDRRFKIVDRANMDKILKEQELSQTGIISPEKAVKIGNVAGAQLILATRIEQGVLEYKIIKVETSEVIAYEFTKLGEGKNTGETADAGKLIIRTGWISADKYQKYFDEKLKIGYYPVEINGRSYNGWSQYYGVYKLNKAGIPWWTHHGLTKNLYDQKVKEYDAQGYKVVFMSNFTDSTNTLRYNAIWYPK